MATIPHSEALEYVEGKLSDAANWLQPLNFLYPLWRIAGSAPLYELCDTVMRQKYTQSQINERAHAMVVLRPLLLQDNSCGLGITSSYCAWTHKNLRIVWPTYSIRKQMQDDHEILVMVALSEIFKRSGNIHATEAVSGTYMFEAGPKSNTPFLWSIHSDHPMSEWLTTTIAYDRFMRELSACIFRCIAVTYRDYALACLKAGSIVREDALMRRVHQLCFTVNPAWARYFHPEEGHIPPPAKSAAVAALHPDDETTLRQALDQIMIIENEERPFYCPNFETL